MGGRNEWTVQRDHHERRVPEAVRKTDLLIPIHLNPIIKKREKEMRKELTTGQMEQVNGGWWLSDLIGKAVKEAGTIIYITAVIKGNESTSTL